MQNTNTKTARKIVRNILKKHNVAVTTQTYTNAVTTNKKDNKNLRNLCFITQNLTDAAVQEVAAALNVKRVHASKCKFYYNFNNMQYLRIVHCSY